MLATSVNFKSNNNKNNKNVYFLTSFFDQIFENEVFFFYRISDRLIGLLEFLTVKNR